MRVGVVIIGRNEGDRLLRCLQSLSAEDHVVVYVDSGSTDGSMNEATKLGAETLALDMKIPFTAARARNAGFQYLIQASPNLEYVQFVDGDCEVMPDWINMGIDFLEAHQDVAVVSGRCRERHPEKSIYNLMCDIEWNTPVGEAMASGGNAMMRVKAFQAVGGFRNQLIAGEEPELCVRLRMAGWKIWRLDEEMVLHDAAMTKFSQWWKRMTRAGYAFAEGAYLHGSAPERHWVKESIRPWIWGLGIPLIGLLLWTVGYKLGMLVLLVYPLQIFRLGFRNVLYGNKAWVMAFFNVLGKFPEMIGQIKFLWRLCTGNQGGLIEYK